MKAKEAGKEQEWRKASKEHNANLTLSREKAVNACKEKWPIGAKKWDELSSEEQKSVQPFTGLLLNKPGEYGKLCDWFMEHNSENTGGKSRRRKTRRRKTRRRR